MAKFAPFAPLSGVPRIEGARVAVVLENKFIPEEIAAYLSGFPLLGAQVELLSRIWYGDYKPASTTFFADVDPGDGQPWSTPDCADVMRDISQARPADYDAVIMAANYTSVRLRYPGELPSDPSNFDPFAHVQACPTVRFFADAMADKGVIKGLLCHGLWILTPNPRLLRGRKVICHSVVMADVLNAGADIEVTPDRVVVDDDLVTGFSKHEVLPFVAAVASRVAERRSKRRAP